MDQDTALVAIVDDEESIRKALVRLFRLARYRTEAFGSAADFLESLAAQSPDCVILDLHMPDMTGIELLQHFARLDRSPPVIVITANEEQSAHDQCVALGVRRYLRKPIDRTMLLESVRAVVGGAH